VRHPEWFDHRLAEVVLPRDARGDFELLCQQLEAGVGVDAPLAWRREHGRAVEVEPARVGEEVAYRRAGWPRGRVEAESSLLDGDETPQGGDQLRDGREGVGGGVVAPDDPVAGAVNGPDSGIWTPLLD